MKRALPFLLLLFAAHCTRSSSRNPPRQAAAAAADETEIRAAINAQSEAWNRADIPAFMQSYEDSPDTTFIGLTFGKGYPAHSRALHAQLHHPRADG